MRKPRGPWSDKKFREALDLAVSEETPQGFKKLRVIADKLTQCAMDGEGWAITAVRDTLDGRPAQDVNVGGSIAHELADLTDGELAARIKRELASLAGRGSEKADSGKLH